MPFYYGLDLLRYLTEYYSARLALATERGFQKAGSKYHWLYDEISERVNVLQQAKQFLDALPLFLTQEDGGEKAFSYMTSFVCQWFSDAFFGSGPGEDAASFYSSQNEYWSDIEELSTVIGPDYDLTQLPQVYVDLCEYLVRYLRLYFQIREKRVVAVDRDKFDEVMGRRVALRAATS